MVTRADVAKKAGVSVGTVSNVMNHKKFVKEEYVIRVKKAIEELNYIPDFTAKSLAKRKNNHIGVAVYEMTNPYHAEIIEGIEEYAAEKGYMVTTFFLDNKLQQRLDAICERRLDALINFMTNELPENFVNNMQAQNTVLVNFNESNSFIVKNNYKQAMVDFMKMLSENGHKNVAYVSTVDNMRFKADSRGETFCSYRNEMGFSEDDTLIFSNDNYSLRSEEIGYLMGERLLKEHPETTAVFTTNDLCALGLIKKLSEKGYKCPSDISVIGCDNIALSSYFSPGLCTIGFNKREYGKEIAKAIINKLDNKNVIPYCTLEFEAKAVVRESIGKVRE